MTITLITASFIMLLLLVLTMRVVAGRWRVKADIGDGNDKALNYAIRAHGNLIEYAPIVLIVLGLLEYNGVNKLWLIILASVFLVARLLHAYGLGFKGGVNKARFFGALFTFIILLVTGITGLLSAYKFI